MARQYRRDANGRFASGGTLGARASLRKSRQKLAAKPTPAQKGAVTRANKKLRQAKKDATVRVAGRRGGTIARPKGYVRPGSKPTSSKPKSTGKPKKPPLPPPVPEAILKASKVTSAAMRDRKRETGIANNIRPSPRRHTAAEAAYWDIKNGKGKSRFRSDKKVREEMRRRGFLKDSKDPQGDLIKIARSARRKKGSWY